MTSASPATPPNDTPSATLADAPTAPETRLPNLDILRGIALLGIFTVNMLFFSGPYGYFGLPAAQNEFERGLEAFVRVFFQGAFYSLFSFLFGVGLALQLRRGRAALPRFRRRLFFLLLIGLVHLIFVWYGDILFSYAAGGFVLTLFAFAPGWAVALGAAFFFWLSATLYLTPLDLSYAGSTPWLSLGAFTQTFGSGSYLEVVTFQARLAGREALNLPGFLPTVLWLFLLGLLAGRAGVLERKNHRVWLAVLAAALPVAVYFKGYVAYWLLSETPNRLSVGYSFAIGGPALMFVYLSLLTLLLRNGAWARRLSWFGFAGRMALTNYLTQSVVCTLVFNAYGLGYFNELGLSVTLPLVLVIFAAQVAFSRFWLSRFRFGPAEWVWRSLTYGARQPLRR